MDQNVILSPQQSNRSSSLAQEDGSSEFFALGDGGRLTMREDHDWVYSRTGGGMVFIGGAAGEVAAPE